MRVKWLSYVKILRAQLSCGEGEEAMPDFEIPCVQCKENFLFTEKEQELFYQRNMAAPQRCNSCRTKKAAAAKSGNDDAPTKFEIVCDHCGKHDRVPFQPKVGRTVLCKECHQASRARMRTA